MVRSRIALKAAFTAILTAASAAPARAADINVISLVALRPVVDQLVPKFERMSQHKVTLTYGGSSDLPKLFGDGKPFDVAITPAPLLERLIKDGKVAAASRTDVTRVAIGVAVKRGAPRPDIGTPEAFKRALLDAKSVSHSAEGPSGLYVRNLLDRLGIAAAMEPKLRPVPGGPLVVGPVSRGEVELAIITVPFIVRDPGADFVGPLPDELQDYVIYAAGVSVAAGDANAARALIGYITSPAAADVIRAHGFDPVR